MACEFVCSGWYATDEARSYITSGDDIIRGAGFRRLWWNSLDTFIKPESVLIVDSAAPIKPGDSRLTSTKVRTIELQLNPGHAQNTRSHYCGYMAAIILGLEFALLNDIEMFLFVEQDALTFGDEIVARTKNALRRNDLVFGSTRSSSVQQSFFAVNKKGIRSFLSALHSISLTDNEVSPEHKFLFAGSRFLPASMISLATHTNIRPITSARLRLFKLACSITKQYTTLPFGYGRERPINFNDDVYYFQQGTAEELAQYKRRTGF